MSGSLQKVMVEEGIVKRLWKESVTVNEWMAAFGIVRTTYWNPGQSVEVLHVGEWVAIVVSDSLIGESVLILLVCRSANGGLAMACTMRDAIRISHRCLYPHRHALDSHLTWQTD